MWWSLYWLCVAPTALHILKNPNLTGNEWLKLHIFKVSLIILEGENVIKNKTIIVFGANMYAICLKYWKYNNSVSKCAILWSVSLWTTDKIQIIFFFTFLFIDWLIVYSFYYRYQWVWASYKALFPQMHEHYGELSLFLQSWIHAGHWWQILH